MPRSRCLSLAFAITVFWCCSSPAAPKVCIVIDPDAPKLEQFAAREMSAQLSKLFGGEATILAAPPVEADGIILLGSPATNPAVMLAMGDAWPAQWNEQCHLIESTKLGDRSVLVVGGNSPVATLWAAYELGHQLGICYLMQSDVYPAEPIQVKLDSFKVRIIPHVPYRVAVLLGDTPQGTSAWTIAEHERLLGQLAKLKFNRVYLDMGSTGYPGWWSRRFRVDSETAGRAAFKGAGEFTNPEFAAATTDEERKPLKSKFQTAVFARAEQLGMQSYNFKANMHLVNWVDRGWTLQPTGYRVESQRAGLNPIRYSNTIHLAPGDLSPAMDFVARSAFEPRLKPEAAYLDLFTAVCAKREVADRLVRGFRLLDENTETLAHPSLQQFRRLDSTKKDLLLTPFASASPPPEWFKKVKERYTQSMVEMFRGHDNCRPDTRKYLYYHCKRGEFAVEYLNCYESVCLAGEAKKAGNQDKCVELLEKAVESLYNGINSLSEVARDPSDRGLIAALNEYAYRPLVKQLEEE